MLHLISVAFMTTAVGFVCEKSMSGAGSAYKRNHLDITGEAFGEYCLKRGLVYFLHNLKLAQRRPPGTAYCMVCS